MLHAVAIPVQADFAQENRFIHLASLEQQRELIRYMGSLNDWLGNDVADRQAEIRSIHDRLNQLQDDLNRLGYPRCRPHYIYILTCH